MIQQVFAAAVFALGLLSGLAHHGLDFSRAVVLTGTEQAETFAAIGPRAAGRGYLAALEFAALYGRH